MPENRLSPTISLPTADPFAAPQRSGLIANLLDELERESVAYCHWKSNWRIERWLTGDGDLDLLVADRDVGKFTTVLSRLGFRKALPPQEKELPGIVNFYGFDEQAKTFIHVHAHYRLVFGHDATKNYHLPIESALIDSARKTCGIFVAAPEHELILFAIRMTLKFSAAESLARRMLGSFADSSRAIQDEIRFLEARSDIIELRRALRILFPMVKPELFDRCLDALRHGSGIGEQLSAKRELVRALSAHSRLSRAVESSLRSVRSAAGLVRLSGLSGASLKRFESGGSMIAFVGGDGSGKSSSVSEISRWLSKRFLTRTIHMGKPPKTVLTLAVAAAQRAAARLTKIGYWARPRYRLLKTENADFLQLLRWFCIARDRYRLYRTARRFAANGGIVLCDRFPVRKISLMDGPKIERSVSRSSHGVAIRYLIRKERWYYSQILPPDMLIVLRVDPDIAVARKTDESPQHVRPRATELWQIDWEGTSAHVIETGVEWPLVLTQLRKVIWERI